MFKNLNSYVLIKKLFITQVIILLFINKIKKNLINLYIFE